MIAKLTIRGLSKAFLGVQALDHVSFSIEQGHLHALLGENGAGKSTLIKVLSGAELADTGELLLNGRPYQPRSPRDAVRAGINTIYQEANLLPDRDVLSNIVLGVELARGPLSVLDRRTMGEQAGATLGRLRAGHISLGARAGSLKAGEKQLVEIARALTHRSDVLIMDEPTAALNRDETNALFEVIRELKAQGVTILYVSHRLEEVFQLADAVTVLRDGKHIRTAPLAAVTPDSLIADMIGRSLTTVFPPRNTKIGEPVLEVSDLSAPPAFEGVSFALHAGEVLGLTGVGGSGHIELGKAIFGAYPIERGVVQVRGQTIHPTPETMIARGVVFLPEDRKTEGVIQALPVRRNLSMVMLGRLANALGVLSDRKETELARQQVERLQIKTPGMGQLVGRLSGGNQQKVALGKGLATGGDILILIGATQGIDVGVKFEIYEFVAEQTANGAAILFISAEMPEILGLSHRIMVMHRGRLAAILDGPTATAEQVLRHALGQVEASQVNQST